MAVLKIKEIEDLLALVQNNSDICWVELRSKIAEQLKLCRIKLKASPFEIMEKTQLTFEQIKQAEDGSEETNLMHYILLYLFYCSHVKE